jgi:hypothetical protein
VKTPRSSFVCHAVEGKKIRCTSGEELYPSALSLSYRTANRQANYMPGYDDILSVTE